MSRKKAAKKIKKTIKHNTDIIEFYTSEKRAEWNKKREEFEEIAEELSKDHDFLVLQDNSLREKLVRKNYPKQKNAKELVKRAMELYPIRIKKFSI